MSDEQISLDFISGYLKVDRQAQKKLEKKENGFFAEETENESSTAPKFKEKLYDKIASEQNDSKTKLENTSVTSLNILLNKEKQNLSFIAKNDDNKGFNVSSAKLEESSQILNDILEKLKNKQS